MPILFLFPVPFEDFTACLVFTTRLLFQPFFPFLSMDKWLYAELPSLVTFTFLLDPQQFGSAFPGRCRGNDQWTPHLSTSPYRKRQQPKSVESNSFFPPPRYLMSLPSRKDHRDMSHRSEQGTSLLSGTVSPLLPFVCLPHLTAFRRLVLDVQIHSLLSNTPHYSAGG